MNNKFSTLIEIVILLIIIALLFVIALPKLMKTYEKSKIEVFLANTQEIYRSAKSQQSKINRETIYNNGIGASTLNYTCNKLNDLSINKDKSIVYTITLNYYGNVTNLSVTNGKYEFIYNGEDLKLNEITEDSVKNIKFGNSEISLSLCN